jgi:hypothetical protein
MTSSLFSSKRQPSRRFRSDYSWICFGARETAARLRAKKTIPAIRNGLFIVYGFRDGRRLLLVSGNLPPRSRTIGLPVYARVSLEPSVKQPPRSRLHSSLPKGLPEHVPANQRSSIAVAGSRIRAKAFGRHENFSRHMFSIQFKNCKLPTNQDSSLNSASESSDPSSPICSSLASSSETPAFRAGFPRRTRLIGTSAYGSNSRNRLIMNR